MNEAASPTSRNRCPPYVVDEYVEASQAHASRSAAWASVIATAGAFEISTLYASASAPVPSRGDGPSIMVPTWRVVADSGIAHAHPLSYASTSVCVGSGTFHSSADQSPTSAYMRAPGTRNRRARTPARPEQSR